MMFFQRTLVIVAGLAGLGLIAGFGWFVQVTERQAQALPPHADGIVALTGGAGRVEQALHLLADGQAGKLLVTGIGGGTDLATLGRIAGVDTARLAARITLGRYAVSTRGNAVETAAWAEENRLRSIIVVTAGYHMPRALAELQGAMPGVTLYPSVAPPPPETTAADHRAGLRLQAEEYAKYLFTISGLSEWLPRREGTAPMPRMTGPQAMGARG